MITMEEKTTVQISIGCPSGSTQQWGKVLTYEALDRGVLEYLIQDIEDLIEERIITWNGDE